MMSNTSSKPLPIDLDNLVLEDDPEESLLPLDPDEDVVSHVDGVLLAPVPHDGLEARLGEDSLDDEFFLEIQDWRTLSPDDPKGDMVQARVTSAIIKKMDHLISRTRGEIWQTRSDFMREAIWQYIRGVLSGLQTSDPVLVSLLTEAELSGRATFHEARRSRLDKALQDMNAYLTDLVNLDDHEEAHRVLLETALRLRRMHIQSWKRQWLLSLNSLPILRITVRLLVLSGWDIPQEFYPAAGLAVGPTLTTVPPSTPAPSSPGATPDE